MKPVFVSRRELLSFSAGLTTSVCLSILDHKLLRAAEGLSDSCIPSSVRSMGIGHETELQPNDDAFLKPGEMVVVQSVNPRCIYYPTQVVVEPGAVYEFDSVGFWKDGWLPKCGPEGWPGLILQANNRLPGRRFFLLCGTMGKTDRTSFAIGTHRQWTAPSMGIGEDNKLYLYANDWPQKYFQSNNNEIDPADGGPLRVSILRVS